MDLFELLGVCAGFAALAFAIYLPVRLLLLVGEVKALEKTLRELAARLPSATLSSQEASARVLSAPVAPAPASAAMPPPLPATRVDAAASASRSPLDPLRDLGLLPPATLKGEYALGAWWAVRVGGVLAVVAVGFLAFWLNLRSTIPPWVRVLEVALIGAGLFWGGLRLAAKRADLGQVAAAAGLAVWQFAAWATYGLEKMRVCESATSAGLIQLLVASLVAVVALAKGSKLFGQLAVIFASLAVGLSIGSGAEPWSTAAGAGLVAFLGAVLMVRGPWGSAGVLGLLGSQVCLLLLYDALPARAADYLPLQSAAIGSFCVLWLGERLVKGDAGLLGREARSAFQLGSFFAPALLSLFLATGGEQARATVSSLLGVLAVLAGLGERRRHRVVCEVLLLGAVGFFAAALAWLVDPHLVWLVWLLAAAAALLVGTRTGSELVRWSAEILGAVSAFAFILHTPTRPWMGLAGIGAFGLLLAFREDWERPSAWQQLRRWVGIASLAFVVLDVQTDLPRADHGWPWLVLSLVAVVRFRSALLWAAAPGYVCTGVLAVFWRPLVGAAGSSLAWAGWSALVGGVSAVALGRLLGREGSGAKVGRVFLALLTSVFAYAFAAALAQSLLPVAAEGWSPDAWQLVLTWAVGAALVVGVTAAWQRSGAVAGDLSLAAAGALLGCFLQVAAAEGAGLRQLGLAQAPFVLLGLAGLLYVLAVHTRGQGGWGTAQRSVLGFVSLFIGAFILLARLPGAGVSLAWALASVLTFVLGHRLRTRSLRMAGLAGLGAASLRVVSHDITDLLGRIAACGALALAFFGVAWLYGRITSEHEAR